MSLSPAIPPACCPPSTTAPSRSSKVTGSRKPGAAKIPSPASPRSAPSPAVRRAVRGNSSIGEAELIWGGSVSSGAWVDGWWLFNGADLAAVEQALSDEVGKSEDWNRDAVGALGDPQQRIGDHCGEELQPDCIIIVSEELADLEVLLDPAEQEFDLPAAFVERGDGDGGALHVVGQQCDGVIVVVTPEAHAAQPDRQFGIAFAGKPHLGIFENGAAVALRHGDRTKLDRLEPHVGFGPRHEARSGGRDRAPPTVMAITFVEHVSGARLDPDGAADLGIVDVGIGQIEDARAVGFGIVDDMHLHAFDASVRLRPTAQPAKGNGARI